MSKIKKTSIVALILLVLGVTGSLLTVNASRQNEKFTEEKVFEDKNIKNLEIKADDAEVQIIPVNEATTKVEVTGTVGNGRKIKLDTQVEGDTLKVDLNERKLKFFNFNFFEKGQTLSVQVPKKTYETLKVEVTVGRIEAENLGVKNVTLSSVDGEIDVEGLETSDISASTDFGKISLENVTGNIIGKSIDGEIFLKTDDLDRNIHFENTTGNIEIQTAKDPTNASIDADAVTGEVEIFNSTNRSVVAGNGDFLINLRTIDGEIIVSK